MWRTSIGSISYSRAMYVKLKVQVYSLISNISSDLYIFTPWSLDLFIRVLSTESIQSCSHLGALNLSYTLPSLSYQVLIFTWVKWSIWGLTALPKYTTSKQCANICRGEILYFFENPAPSGIQNRTQAAISAKLRALIIAPCPSLQCWTTMVQITIHSLLFDNPDGMMTFME